MQVQLQVPVLIFAQSGRYLAQSATQAGHTVWVADCFGDIDTLNIAERWQKLPSLHTLTNAHLLELLTTFANGQECQLVCGGGIEKNFPILSQLPTNINYIGNNSDTIKKIKMPQLFFSLLSRHSLPYPSTQLFQPEAQTGWLFKQSFGLGGTHITRLDREYSAQEGYFQQHITGISASILFLADGNKTQVIAINKQLVSDNQAIPFQLAAIETPFEISQPNHYLLTTAIDSITKETGLKGLNSLDFILDKHDQLFILEVNPRPSASIELVDHELIFQQHIQACRGTLPSETRATPSHYAGLYYLYAPQTVTIPLNMVWPLQSHDQPHAGTVIEIHQPICTIMVTELDQQRCRQKQHLLSLEIMQQLTKND
ncbi:hypothetical protein A9Q79_00680 [Methylophaga sp. 42_25_T18]|nr:hypothetical protein A9Q79_00680 [Methylophaga sp. 42_25_T18]